MTDKQIRDKHRWFDARVASCPRGALGQCDLPAARGETHEHPLVSSQFDLRGRYGGVVPELASRAHLRALVPVVRQVVEHRLGWPYSM